MTEPTIMLGGVSATKPTADRFSGLVWGQSGVGKTTLASTLPGKIALINFDPDGPASIADADNVDVFDLSGTGPEIVGRMKGGDPLGIKSAINDYDSFIVDSMTTIVERTLAHGISITKGATLERPSPGAYGARNAVAVELARNLLILTKASNKHIMFIAHEGPQERNDDGVALDITMALGGQLPQNMSVRLNEVWSMYENNGKKYIILRKSRMRSPVKTRMFSTAKEPEFVWRWNVENRHDPDNMWIKDWFEAWKENEFRKLELPK